jgi:hypothetical protein
VTQILQLIKVTRDLLQHRILEAARATSAAPNYFTNLEVSKRAVWRDFASQSSTPIPPLALFPPGGHVLHLDPQHLQTVSGIKYRAGLLDLELQDNKNSYSSPADTSNESGRDGDTRNDQHLANGTHEPARRGPGGVRPGQWGGRRGQRNRDDRTPQRNPRHTASPGPDTRQVRLFSCLYYAAGSTENIKPQCYKTAVELQRLKDVRTTDPIY